MQLLSRILLRNSSSTTHYASLPKYLNTLVFNPTHRLFSSGGGADGVGGGDGLGWDDGSPSSWSTGLTKDQFAGAAVGHQVPTSDSGGGGGWRRGVGGEEGLDNTAMGRMQQKLKELQVEAKETEKLMERWGRREEEVCQLLEQVHEPGARGSYLKDSEKAEMYKKHKENPEEYTVERLAKEYRIMRQRVAAILWLKEDEEEMEKKHGPLDDAVEMLLDTVPEFFVYHDREYHVASLPYKPDFKVMPEGWDGTPRDPDEVHYEISKKEDDWLYEDFVRKFNFNKLKFKKEIKVHLHSRRRDTDGWKIVVENMGSKGKRGAGGGWKVVSLPDGSTRPLDGMEKMFLKRETPRRRRRIIHPKKLSRKYL